MHGMIMRGYELQGRERGRLSGDDDDDDEVQSSYKGPLGTMDELEDVLPVKHGISQFYRGKSKSFASPANAESSSVEDLAKPENPYNRKRKNLLARSQSLGKNFGSALNNSGIPKNLAIIRSNSMGNIISTSSTSSSFLPPRHALSRRSSRSGLGVMSAPLQKNPRRSASWCGSSVR